MSYSLDEYKTLSAVFHCFREEEIYPVDLLANEFLMAARKVKGSDYTIQDIFKEGAGLIGWAHDYEVPEEIQVRWINTCNYVGAVMKAMDRHQNLLPSAE